MPGMQSPSGTTNPGLFGHCMVVQTALLFKPLAGHVQVLHPSGAVHDKCGQHWSSGRGSSGVGSCSEGVEHFKLVQLASFFEPLRGHMHVFKPSPAG